MSQPVPESWLRLAGVVLDMHVNREVSGSCDDFDWPEWFPTDQRESLVRVLEDHNDPSPDRAEEIEESVDMYATGESAPGANWLGGFFVDLLTGKYVLKN